jgi:outer membrane protein assembly factor BamA
VGWDWLASWKLVAIVAGDPSSEPAPRDDDASGIARPARRPGRKLLWIPRGLLFVPRQVVRVALSPVRVVMWAYDRYDLDKRFQRAFFWRPGIAGIYPTVRFNSGFGGNIGVRMVHRDLFRRGFGLGVFAMYGKNYGKRFQIGISTPLIAQRFGFGAMLEYRYIPADRFFGIGNAELVNGPIDAPIDPTRRDVAVDTRFAHTMLRTSPVAAVRLGGGNMLSLSTTLAWRRFGHTDNGTKIDTAIAFDRRALVGYEGGVTNLYTQLRWDLDRRRHRVTPALTSSGWRAAVYGGYTVGFFGDPSRYGRVGIDVQRYVDLWEGTRVLLLRAAADSAIGPYHRIPFVDLPALGGPYYLRGYPRDRFRDRVAAFATVEYTHVVDGHIAVFVFVEPGAVWSGVNDLGAGPIRVGYGGGLQLHSARMFLMRLQLASSLEGGVQINFNFAPAFQPRNRR